MNTDLPSLLTNDLQLIKSACDGQVVIVTGAGGGIGLQCARAFAMLGAKVALAEISATGQAAETLIRAEGGQATFIPCDVSDPQAIQHLLTRTHEIYGPVHTLINNAIYIRECAIQDMPLEMWEKTMAVNLRGTFLTSQAVLTDMLAQSRGVIINMVSTDAMPGLGAYIASKQGICGFSQTLDIELDHSGVYVIPFAPGMVDTPGIRSVAQGLAPRLGLQLEEFLNLSLHAAYHGLMPAEHAAAATILLATRWASEYHGQLVNGYEILERSGLLAVPETMPGEETRKTTATTLGSAQLLERLARILHETEAELDRLPIFVRPIARQGFKSKSGMSLPDWQRLLDGLQQAGKSYPANWQENLLRLAQYYQDVPDETARFTHDEATLKEVSELSHQRVALIRQLSELDT